jgi:hypothetical protein
MQSGQQRFEGIALDAVEAPRGHAYPRISWQRPTVLESVGCPPRRRAGSRMRGSACTRGPERHWTKRHALRSLASTSDTRCHRQPPALVSPRAEDMMMATAEAKGEHGLGSRCHLALDALGERSGPVAAACRRRAALCGFLDFSVASRCTRGTILRAPDPGAHLSLPSSHPAIHPARLSREGLDEELASAHADPHGRSCPLTGARARGSGAASRRGRGRGRGGASAPVQDVYPLDRHMGRAWQQQKAPAAAAAAPEALSTPASAITVPSRDAYPLKIALSRPARPQARVPPFSRGSPAADGARNASRPPANGAGRGGETAAGPFHHWLWCETLRLRGNRRDLPGTGREWCA